MPSKKRFIYAYNSKFTTSPKDCFTLIKPHFRLPSKPDDVSWSRHAQVSVRAVFGNTAALSVFRDKPHLKRKRRKFLRAIRQMRLLGLAHFKEKKTKPVGGLRLEHFYDSSTLREMRGVLDRSNDLRSHQEPPVWTSNLLQSRFTQRCANEEDLRRYRSLIERMPNLEIDQILGNLDGTSSIHYHDRRPQ